MSPRDTPDNEKNNKRDRAQGVPGRGHEDNVTYVNFGKRRKVDSAEETLRDDARSTQAPLENLRESIEQSAVEHHNRQQPRWSKRITSDKPRDSIFNTAAERIMNFVSITTACGRRSRGHEYTRAG